MNETKKPWQSKTILLNAVLMIVGALTLLGFAPESVEVFIKANTEIILTALGFLGLGLRAISKGKISIFE